MDDIINTQFLKNDEFSIEDHSFDLSDIFAEEMLDQLTEEHKENEIWIAEQYN
tara:strand:+ start:824 stop:982 length:159 start_codon:yes stop_codon:yes gene_type:complete